MPSEFSFDVVSEVDLNIVRECVDVAMKEITNRYDFRGADASIELIPKENKLIFRAQDENRIDAAIFILNTRMAKRNLPLKNFTKGKLEEALGQTARAPVEIQSGIPSDKAKEIVASLKKVKLKVNATIQGDQLRITSKSKDALQEAMAHLRAGKFDLELQFKNFR